MAAEAALNRLGVTLALIHASALTAVSGMILLAARGRSSLADAALVPWVSGSFSILGGTFLGWLLVSLAAAARRGEARFTAVDRALVIASGIACGLTGPYVLLSFFTNVRW